MCMFTHANVDSHAVALNEHPSLTLPIIVYGSVSLLFTMFVHCSLYLNCLLFVVTA